MADRAIDETDHKGERHPHAKLAEEDVLAIRADNRPHDVIALDYGVHKGNVSKIKLRTTWKHI